MNPDLSLRTGAVSGRMHYAWIVAAITFVIVVLTAGVRAAPGVLIVPLEHEFQWSRATISFAIGVNVLLYGVIGPFAAALIDRFGARRTVTLSLAATATGVALTPLMTETWQLVLLWGVVVGLGCGFTGAYLGPLIAARWFKARQGFVIGVLTAGNAAGQLVFLPTMAALVTSAGWRVMSLILAASVLVFVPLVVWLMRDRPESVGLLAYGETHAGPASRASFASNPSANNPSAGNPPAGNPIMISFRALGDGARSRDFWLIAGSYFVCGASTNGLIGTHLIPACVDHGLTEVVGAGLLAATGVFAFIGGTASGWLSDRFDPRFLLFWYYGLRGLSLIYLPFALDTSFYGLSLFAVFYGLDWIAGVPPTVRLLNRAMGAERIGIMVAWITVIHQIGGAGAAYLGGVFRIGFGTYFEAFVIAGLMCIGAALMVLFIGAGRSRLEPQPAALPAE
ncbi:MAG: MFS transporter [Alphaproteobacteria bacterium]